MSPDDGPVPPRDAPPPPASLTTAAGRRHLDHADRDNAARLYAWLKDEMIYVHGRGWAVWNGSAYDFEAGEPEALGRAMVLREMLEEEAAFAASSPVGKEKLAEVMAETGLDEEQACKRIRTERRRKLRAKASAAGNVRTLKAALTAGEHLFRRAPRDLDSDLSRLQLPNGTLRLDELAKPGPEAEEPEERIERWLACFNPDPERDHLPTKVAGAAFDPHAECEGFERFLDLAMPGLEEQSYLQRACGMILGGQENETALILLGQGGNGKSTLVRAIELVMGTYCQPCRIEMFCETRAQLGVTPEEAALPGARAYLASEPDTKVTLSASKMKGLTGGDTRQANPKNKDVFSFRPEGVPILQANKMPNVNDPSEGFWRRINPVLFRQNLAQLPTNQRMTSKAVSEMLRRERSGILNWMLEGYALYMQSGLCPPPDVLDLKGDLRSLADPFGEFLSDMCEIAPGASITTSGLRIGYLAWAEREGHRELSAKAITAEMKARDFAIRKNVVRCYVGIDLNEKGLACEAEYRERHRLGD